MKWLKGLAIVVAIVVAVSVVLFWLLSAGCGNQPYQQFVSENGLYKAVVFQRDCGATTGFSTQMSIIAADEELCDNCAGDLFSADGHPEENKLKLQWNGDTELQVVLPDGIKIYRRETQWQHWFDKVQISYRY